MTTMSMPTKYPDGSGSAKPPVNGRLSLLLGDNVYLDEDKLPQPYRTIDKVITHIFNAAWEQIVANEQAPKRVYTEGSHGNEAAPVSCVSRTGLAGPACVALADTEAYVGRSDGCAARVNVMFDQTSLVSHELHARPITHLAVSYVFVPVVASSEGEALSVVCFPLAPVRTEHTGSISLSSVRAGSRCSLADVTDQEERAASEKERMVTLLSLSAEEFVPAPAPGRPALRLQKLHFSPCGRRLAAAFSEDDAGAESGAAAADGNDHDGGGDGAAAEPPPPPPPPASVVRVYHVGSVAEVEMGSEVTLGKEPELELRVTGRRADVHFTQTKEHSEQTVAHEVVVVAVGGHTVTVASLREPEDDGNAAHLTQLLERAAAAHETHAESVRLLDGGAGGDAGAVTRKPSKGKMKDGGGGSGGGGAGGAGAKGLFHKEPTAPRGGTRVFNHSRRITGSCLGVGGELLAVACEGGLLSVVGLASSTAVFSAVLDQRRYNRTSGTRTRTCTAMALYAQRYLASSWTLTGSTESTLYIHDLTAESDAHETYRVGDHVEVYFPSVKRWLAGSVRRVHPLRAPPAPAAGAPPPASPLRVTTLDGGSATVIFDAALPAGCAAEHAPADPAEDAAAADAAKPRANEVRVSAASPHVRRRALVGRVQHVPSVSALYFCPLAPLLFFLPRGGGRLTVYDVLAARICCAVPAPQTADAAHASMVPFSDGVAVVSLAPEVPAEGGEAGEEGAAAAATYTGTITAVSLPSVVKAVYPTVGEALTSFAGIDHIYGLLLTSHHTDLHDEQYVHTKVMYPQTTAHKPSICSQSRRGTTQGTKSAKGAAALPFGTFSASQTGSKTRTGASGTKNVLFSAAESESKPSGYSAFAVDEQNLLGSNARCLVCRVGDTTLAATWNTHVLVCRRFWTSAGGREVTARCVSQNCSKIWDNALYHPVSCSSNRCCVRRRLLSPARAVVPEGPHFFTIKPAFHVPLSSVFQQAVCVLLVASRIAFDAFDRTSATPKKKVT